jgi:hypothetical protein
MSVGPWDEYKTGQMSSAAALADANGLKKPEYDIPLGGLSPSDVTPVLAVGQYWACKCPLSLIRIERPTSEVSPSVKTIQWTPKRSRDAAEIVTTGLGAYASLESYKYNHLWFEARVPRNWGSRIEACLEGDVWMYVWPRDEEKIFFVGPETDEKCIHILADWQVPESHEFGVQLRLLQAGAEHRNLPAQPSVFDYLRKPGL